jgi:hypothetical protein
LQPPTTRAGSNQVIGVDSDVNGGTAGGVSTGGGGTSHRGHRGNHLLPFGAGLGCIGLVSFVTTWRRRRIV